MDETVFPPIDSDLLEYLEKHYRDTVPDPRDDDRSIWMHVGQVHLVRHLRSLYEMQNEDALTATMKKSN